MKNLIIILALAIVAVISSCSKDDNPVPGVPEPVFNNYRLLTDYSFSYEYSVAGKIIKRFQTQNPTTYYKSYTYGINGKIEKIENISPQTTTDTQRFDYDSGGKLLNIISENKAIGGDLSKSKYVYSYNALGQMNKEESFVWIPATSQFESTPSSRRTYTYNSAGKISKDSQNAERYDEFDYDINGNLTEQRIYESKNAETVSYLYKKRKYTYDNQKNPYYNLYPTDLFFAFWENTSPNNILTTTEIEYTEAGVATTINRPTLSYTYNGGSYPITVVVGLTPIINKFTYLGYN
jgi:hypothetical protein